MAKYSVSPLNYNGAPAFHRSKEINDTESKMFIELSKEIDKGVPGFYIHQEHNRSGLKVRYLTKENGKFVVRDASNNIIMAFTVNNPKSKSTPPQPKSTSTPRSPKSNKPKPYSYLLECQEPFLRISTVESPKFETLKQTYAHAYKTLKNHKHRIDMCCIIEKNGDFMDVPRSIIWDKDTAYLQTYGREHHVFRVCADGSVKKL